MDGKYNRGGEQQQGYAERGIGHGSDDRAYGYSQNEGYSNSGGGSNNRKNAWGEQTSQTNFQTQQQHGQFQTEVSHKTEASNDNKFSPGRQDFHQQGTGYTVANSREVHMSRTGSIDIGPYSPQSVGNRNNTAIGTVEHAIT